MRRSEAEKLHKDFYGHEYEKEFEIDLGEMSHLTVLGRVNAIEYNAKKYSDKKTFTYRHKFKKMPLLLTNGKEMIIYGEFEITDRGIEG